MSCLLCPVPFLLLTLCHPFPAFYEVKKKLRSASEGFPGFVASFSCNMNICTFHYSFSKRLKRDHPQDHRKGKGYHCSRPRHYNTDDDRTIWQSCQQCQKTSHHPNQGQYFDCSESQPSSLLSHCDNPQPSVIPAPQSVLPGLGRVCTQSSQELDLDKQRTGDGGGEIPQGQSKKHQEM